MTSALVVVVFGVVRHMRTDPFLNGLQYELNNRAFTRVSMERLAAEPADSDTIAFWRAYLELERLNHRKYRPIADKYNLRVSDSVVALKTQSAQVASWMFPEKLLDFMTEATVDYVADLRTLQRLAPEEDQAFFDYVAAQEQAQAEALQHARDGGFDLGARVLEDFVAGHLLQ